MTQASGGSNNGLWIVGVGLVLVIFARGLDSLSLRGVAKASAARSQADDREEAEELQEEYEDVRDSQASKAYYYEWIFLLGTLTLAIGLMITSATAVGMVRILSMILMGLLLVSIYIGGIAWIGSVANTVRNL